LPGGVGIWVTPGRDAEDSGLLCFVAGNRSQVASCLHFGADRDGVCNVGAINSSVSFMTNCRVASAIAQTKQTLAPMSLGFVAMGLNSGESIIGIVRGSRLVILPDHALSVEDQCGDTQQSLLPGPDAVFAPKT
jgi:hypothetical protein